MVPEARKASKRLLPSRVQGQCGPASPCSQPRKTDFEVLISRTVREEMRVVLNHHVHDNLLQRTKKANTALPIVHFFVCACKNVDLPQWV